LPPPIVPRFSQDGRRSRRRGHHPDSHQSGALEIPGNTTVEQIAALMPADATFGGIDVAVDKIGQGYSFDSHAFSDEKARRIGPRG
jgi:hypothetical protein